MDTEFTLSLGEDESLDHQMLSSGLRSRRRLYRKIGWFLRHVSDVLCSQFTLASLLSFASVVRIFRDFIDGLWKPLAVVFAACVGRSCTQFTMGPLPPFFCVGYENLIGGYWKPLEVWVD
jgi:hypothetical protein